MAIDLTQQYPLQVDGATTEYPLGKARNVTSPDDVNATPLDEAWMNDLFGAQQALLSRAGIVPSGVPDNAVTSQHMEALDAVIFEQVGDVDALRQDVTGNTDAIGNIDTAYQLADSGLQTQITDIDTAYQAADVVLQDQINSIGGGSYAYLTYDDMVAAGALPPGDPLKLPANSSVDVTNDPDPAKNGKYSYDGTTFTLSDYDPLALSKDYTDAAQLAAENDATAKANAAIVEAAEYTDLKTEMKLDGAVGKNLFNKLKVTTGTALNDTGGTFTATARNVSEFIAVQPNTAYSFSGTTKAAFYDANKAFVQISQGATANVISASNAAFLRIDVTDASLGTAQIEQNVSKTTYEAYKIELSSNSVSASALKPNSVSADKLQPFSVAAKNFKDAVFLNMFDISTLRKGLSISLTDGKTESANATQDITDYIPCKPNTRYSSSSSIRVFYYTMDGAFISVENSTAFTTPANCYQLRFNLAEPTSYRFQLNEGAVLSELQPYKYILPKLATVDKTKSEINAITARKYNFSDAWIAWRDGQKFPICFLGDSTTNGNGTTGYTIRTFPYDFTLDYIAPNSYPSVFQALIREATGNNVMRAYNAGFSGQKAAWAALNMDAIMGSAYADTKIMGISHGINDRTSNPALYTSNFYRDIETIINWCFGKGIQPFLITTQPITIPSQVGTASASDMEQIANNIKKNLADKYGLELIDVSKFGQQFMRYSSKPLLNDIMESGGNVIHFGDGGHKFTAELMFANFCKRTIWTYNDGDQLDYITQLQKSDIDFSQLNQLATFKQGFKNEVLTTQDTATNKLYQDYYVFNAGRKQLNLTAYYANAAVGQYVLVDGVQTTITTQGQSLGALDLGLHRIRAYSSATTALDWLGFKLL